MYLRHRLLAWASVAVVGLAAAGTASAHHNDWAAPLVGGALGGYALGTLVADQRPRTEKVYEPAPAAAPVYYSAPAYVATPSTASIETQLNQLDKLAAGGYITPAEYKERRQAILDEM
jgi:ABC-type sugar transport system substrate-binding protein